MCTPHKLPLSIIRMYTVLGVHLGFIAYMYMYIMSAEYCYYCYYPCIAYIDCMPLIEPRLQISCGICMTFALLSTNLLSSYPCSL